MLKRGMRLGFAVVAGWVLSSLSAGAIAAETFPHWFPRSNGVSRTAVTYTKCGDCHRQPPEVEISPKAKPDIRAALLRGIRTSNWVTRTEETIWLDHDRHVQAFAVLGNSQSQHMAKLLGIDDATRDRRCLACHSSKPVWEPGVEVEPNSPFLLTTAEATRFSFLVGVDCEGCHGPSEKPKGSAIPDWISEHTSTPDPNLDDPAEAAKFWRFYSPQTKLEHGYVDVRSPYVQTQMCLSCHMGDVTMGRIVTHEMFAAGHPPLPAFEVATFRHQMPPHWQPLSKKPPAVVAQFNKLSAAPYNPGTSTDTRLMLLGALASVRQYLILLSDLSQPEAEFPGPDRALRPPGPELAAFDCTACHHDLRDKSWRQTRQLKIPGRPLPRLWTSELAIVALEIHKEGAESLRQELAALRDALYAQPFGDSARLKEIAGSAVPKLDQWAQALEKRTWDSADSLAVVRHIAELGKGPLLDYETARSYYWLAALALHESKLEAAPAQAALSKVGSQFLTNLHSSSISNSGEGLLEAVENNRLPLLPKLTPGSVKTGDQAIELLQVDLQRVFDPIAAYDPYVVQEGFSQLLIAIPAE
ncbi:MAG: multiheme c-type cytochrome [Planctomycetaceae bacterium]|nr:multiheme c-type cytochrome [Planctomycetaceae bacterium]